MCTVSYLPLGQDSCLTSNRDEHIARATSSVVTSTRKKIELEFPQDPEAQGSWIAIAPQERRYACLLNGAFVKHDRKTPYRLSRGILLLDALTYGNGMEFLEHYSLDDIEPFTLILGNAQDNLEEIKWDGQNAHHTILDPSIAHLWCSPTLYNETDTIKKKHSFIRFLEDNAKSYNDLKVWHHTQYYQDTVDHPISDQLKTLSITQVVVKRNSVSINHNSLIT